MFALVFASLCGMPFLELDDPTSTKAAPFESESVQNFRFDLTGRRLVGVTFKSELLYWERDVDKPLVLPLGKSNACGAVLSEDGRKAVVFYHFSGPEVWDLEKKAKTGEIDRKAGVLVEPRMSPDGRFAAALSPSLRRGESGSKLLTWKTSDWTSAGIISSSENMSAYCFSPDGSRIIAGSAGIPKDGKPWGDSSLIVVDMNTLKEVDRIPYGFGFPVSLCVSPDGRWIAAGGGYTTPAGPNANDLHGHLRVFDASEKKLVSELHQVETNYVRATAFSIDGSLLYCGSQAARPELRTSVGELKAFSTKDWTLKWTTTIGTDNPHEIAVSPLGKSLLFPAREQLYVVDAMTGEVTGQKLRFKQPGK